MTHYQKDGGFTLIEILVVIAITIMITGFLLSSFSQSNVALDESVTELRSAIREAQADALSGVLYGSVPRCGYGIHFYDSPTSYILYTGPINVASDYCTKDTFVWNAGTSTTIRTISLPSNTLVMDPGAVDIYFVPPNPTTYIGGIFSPGTKETIQIRKIGGGCPDDCRTVTVTTAGTIQTP